MSSGTGEPPEPAPLDERPARYVKDPRELRALAHPVRVALLELLMRSGPMTATEAGAALGETPANASFHLRTLARYGLVEEAPGERRGRQRPWQAAVSGVQVDPADDDPEADLATSELAHVVLLREVDRVRDWLIHRSGEPAEWRSAPFVTGSRLVYLTVDEVNEVERIFTETIDRFRGRASHPERRPPGAREMSVVALAVPVEPLPAPLPAPPPGASAPPAEPGAPADSGAPADPGSPPPSP